MQKLTSYFSKKTLLILGVVLLSSFTLIKYAFNRNDVVLELIFGSLNQYHYSPLTLNDQFSEKVFQIYIRNIDYNKKYLLESDLTALEKYKLDIDNQLLTKRHDFFNLASQIIVSRIKQKEVWSKELLTKPFNYSEIEEYETDWKKTTFAKTESELKNEWKKMLKYQILSRLDEALTKQELAKEKKDTSVKILTFDSLEIDARRKTLKANIDFFKRLNKITPRERFSEFATAITKVYDPHTEYFVPKERKKFDQAMSAQFEGIGARLQQKDGILKVSEIIVGSPSHKQGELKAGDDIIKVAQGNSEPIDIINMDIDEAIELIKGKKEPKSD